MQRIYTHREMQRGKGPKVLRALRGRRIQMALIERGIRLTQRVTFMKKVTHAVKNALRR